jgi:RNA-directed DNA polymerase
VGFLGQIRGLLKSGEFRPVEVRQVMIPKGNTGKFRKLGIPTIADGCGSSGVMHCEEL